MTSLEHGQLAPSATTKWPRSGIQRQQLRRRRGTRISNLAPASMTLSYAWNLCAYITLLATAAALPQQSRASASASALGDPADGQPYFGEPLSNLTIPVGRDAIFQCTVHNLQSYQVAWFHKDKHTLLALQEKVIFRNGRLRVSQASNTFYLHIHDVREEDRGTYLCQINSYPMKSQTGHLQVVVPPRFVEQLTSSDTEVREDSSVSLRCAANGFPSPEIKWRREDGQHINIQSGAAKRVNTVKGQWLNITKAQRLHMGAYICISSNGIPPAVSKRIFLGVNFSPLVWTPDQLIGAPIGSDVTLDCNLESHPHSVTYWTRNNGQQIIVSNAKYDSIIVEGTSSVLYKSEMRLKIKDLRPEDLGAYTCVAKNSLGEARGTIKVYEIPRPSTQTSDVMLYTSASKEHSNRRNKYYIGTKSSVAFEDNQSEKMNKAIVLTDAHDPASEHITLQGEEEKSNLDSSLPKQSRAGASSRLVVTSWSTYPLILLILLLLVQAKH